MDLLENPKLPNMLRRLSTKDFKKFDNFMWNGSHISAVIRYLQKSGGTNDNSVDLLERLEASRNTSRFPRMVLSFTERLREFFTLPKLEFSTNYRTNEILASFLDFLLDTVEQIVKCHADMIEPVSEQIEILQSQLMFLITILVDSPFCCTEIEKTKNFFKEMEGVVDEVGNFLYVYFFTDEGAQSTIDLSLSKLIKKFYPFERKIQAHCISVSKLPACVVPKAAVESLFIVDSLLNDLRDLLNRDDDLIFDVWDEIKNLQEELLFSKLILNRLQEQQHPELQTRIIGVAYEAEYLVNSFTVGDIPAWYLTLRLPHIVQMIKLIGIGFEEYYKIHDSKYIISTLMIGDIPVWYPTLRFVIDNVEANGVRSVKKKYDTETQIINGIVPGEEGSSQAREVPVADEIIVGFKHEAINIADQLAGGPKQLQIIFICGMPGLGKTTLAKKLYNDPAVFGHFDHRAWCVVSETYRKKNLLMEILSSVSDLDHAKMLSMDADSLGLELYKSLMGQKYFIVVDDIWSADVWRDLRRSFPSGGNGSRILLTSRIKEVAPTDSIIQSLPFLSDEECWNLLKQKVFHKENCPQELVEIGTKIAVYCQGLPLAAVVIAAVLENMERKKGLWNEVLRNLNSQISKDPNKCMNILELSYKHLPSHLKPCFLYFGAFPEDREISVWKLTSLWIAEGFVQKEGDKSLTTVAEKYLMDLIDRSLVIVAKRRSNGGVKACSAHDLLRYLCLRKGEEENFLNLIKDKFSIHERRHRLCIPFESSNVESRPFGPHVRSLLGHWSEVSFSYSRLKRLRIMDLSSGERPEDSQTTEDLDLTGMENLVHLRYLEVRLTAETITMSVCTLQNLEFLYFDGSGSVEIPAPLLDLVKLKHLHVKAHAKFNESCHKRVILKNGFQMNSLESISNLWIVHENDEKTLKFSPHLRRLKCATKPFRDSSEKCYRYLILDYLSNLESLSITYLGSEFKFSDTISFPGSLKKLTLHEFKLSWKEMSMIARLPKLEVLKLLYIVFEGKEWKTNDDEFQNLRFLKLDALKIHRWSSSSDHFPKLQSLVMQKCWKLKKFPSALGDSSTLQIIDIHSCSKSLANSALQVQKDQEDMGNEFKVIVSGTCW